MSNPMRYIRDLEAVGFQRAQAEAQVQMVLDVLEGDLVTKSDFAIFQERLFTQLDKRFEAAEKRTDQRFEQVDKKFVELELRLITRLGFLTVSSVSIAVAMLTWLIKP